MTTSTLGSAKRRVRLVGRYGHHVGIDEAKLKIGRYLFDRHGGKVVFLGRFVSVLPYLRSVPGRDQPNGLAPLPRLQRRREHHLGRRLTFVAYKAGDTFRKASGTINLTRGGAVVVAFVATTLIVRRQSAKLTDKAETASPGPLY